MPNLGKATRKPGELVIALAALLCAIMLCVSCASSPAENSSSQASASSSDTASEPGPSTAAQSADEPIVYPTGWLVVPAGDIPAGAAVSVEYLPAIDIVGHQDGQPIDSAQNESLRADWEFDYEGMAVVSFDGMRMPVDPDIVLVNLPDILENTVFDIAYSYAATSQVGGQDIPGITGQQLAGYAAGKQPNAYRAGDEYAVPCAYATAVKLQQAESILKSHGYQLLVYDAYRPMDAQLQLSSELQAAYDADPAIQAAVEDSWGLGWYVSPGASGHNFGTDVDVCVCDASGEPLPMPSTYDAFDESGHLTAYPLGSDEITADAYRPEVLENEACSTLHEAFVDAGFSELASEWWHFADDETESRIRALVGDAGLNFPATT